MNDSQNSRRKQNTVEEIYWNAEKTTKKRNVGGKR
jgi:hypothetical protein